MMCIENAFNQSVYLFSGVFIAEAACKAGDCAADVLLKITVPSDPHREGCQVPGQAGPPTLTEALLGTFCSLNLLNLQHGL